MPGLKDPSSCEKEDCFIHSTGGKRDCSKEGLIYKGTCLTCKEIGPSIEVDRDGKVRLLTGVRRGLKSIYWGKRGFNSYTRGRQHLEALKKPKKHTENAFVRHREDFHKGEEEKVKYRLDVVRCYARAMDRQIGEGCFILSPEADLLMNGKMDHMQPVVGRMIVSTTVQSGRRRNRNTG